MITTSTTESPRERPGVVKVDPRGRPIFGGSNQSRPSIDWRNTGTNSIPDSDSSRPKWAPSPSLPAAPGAPVVRSRPRIADPHIRTVSFPAESTARLACEAQGEPKPSITWTKVSTGALMSIHSRAERFVVLPNGTLVIQNVQLQDRGTYICSAQSVLGRDRLLTNLEVWTRPPRMQLAIYRDITIHQGGEVHLECQADGVPSPLLSWVLPDRSVLTSSSASTSRITMDTNGTLHISATLTGDRGVYRCVASNSAGAASASARVHVSSLPPVIQQAKEQHLLLSPGRPVYAHCSARGAPPPTLRWRIPDGTIVRQSQFLHGNLFVLPNGTLHIRGVRHKDSGNYECIASNAVGADKRTVRVEIEGSAEGERSQSEARNEEAKATEKTSPLSSLNKDRTLSIPSHPSNSFNSARLSASSPFDRSRTLPLNPSSSRSSFYPHPPTATNSPPKINKTVTAYPTRNINKTKLSPLSPSSTMPTNNTKVSAGIINNTKVISSSLSKKNTASAALHPLPVSPFSKALIVSTSPSSTTVQYGIFLQLHCSVTGNPPPIIIWRTPIRKLVDMHYSFDHRLKVHPNGTLSIQALTEKDAGDYLCIARNKVSDDYRLLRVSVVTKPAKIEPKQPLNQIVSFGTPLKVDCQASGLPDPSVRWSLPDGTIVNSVMQGEDRGGRPRRLTVFDNGTLLVPAVGMGEEGEFTCYAENRGGQDTMKVKVKVMMTSLPTFTDDRSQHVIKVREGATATIPCQATGVPAPTMTWFSPTHRVIPKSLGSGFYSERVVVVSGGTLEVRLVQKIDTGNYTCRASNSAGERSMLVSLEVEAANHGQSGQLGGRGWSTSNQPDSGHSSRSGESPNNAGTRQVGFTNGDTSKLGSNDSINNGYSDNDGRTKNIVPNAGTNIGTSGFYPALRSDSRDGLNRPLSGITTQLGRSVISVGVSGAKNTGVKADSIGTNQNGPGITSNSNSLSSSHSTVRSDNVERNPGTNTNEVNAGANVRIHMSNTGAITGSLSGNVFSRSSSNGVIAAGNTGTKNNTNTVVGVVTTVKQQAVKGQTVVLPCPSQGSPPPRLAWLLPGNGVLPAPYYGSRLTVHRNGSLELRGVRASDSGTLVCVVRSERGQTRIQVELEVSEPQEDARLSHRGRADERPVQGSVGVIVAPRPGASLDSAKSLSSRPVLPEVLHPKIQVTQKPFHRGQSLPAAPRPLPWPSSRSSSSVSVPAVITRTAPLVSIVNGENLRLPCPASQTNGHTQGSLSWTIPSGKVLSRGESDDSGRHKVQEDGILTVQQASVFDRGTFTCRSTSGDSVSVITVPVIVIAYPPRITIGPSPVTYTRPGVAVELPCRTIATPRATVTWETPDLTQLRVMGQARIYGNRYLSPQGSLVIQNPTSRDTGFYRCTAKNVIGVDTKATYLHVI
ncbi:LOW QUALITY PROTEIN: matrix-remodeling-associated protein 5-like [Eleginops maclovinus]|uniref:LOW QUALITY PROTEIN: matrix-remodeling-associated protein 5-like n=1 Tax=Eleginops maclovinus TaxID=56733 RepID=UPI00308088C0